MGTATDNLAPKRRKGRPPIWTIAGDKPGERLTILDCSVGNHTGHFTISRLPDGRWACDKCRERLA